jgi:hypothetical protein
MGIFFSLIRKFRVVQEIYMAVPDRAAHKPEAQAKEQRPSLAL